MTAQGRAGNDVIELSIVAIRTERVRNGLVRRLPRAVSPDTRQDRWIAVMLADVYRGKQGVQQQRDDHRTAKALLGPLHRRTPRIRHVSEWLYRGTRRAIETCPALTAR